MPRIPVMSAVRDTSDDETVPETEWRTPVMSWGTLRTPFELIENAETPDVATNHDLCYAKSTDGGKSWQQSTGEKYQLPFTAKSAEYVTCYDLTRSARPRQVKSAK